MTPFTFGHPMRAEWMLDPGVTYLNHGTVGAVPRRVLAAQQAIRDRIESQPSRVLLRELSGLVGMPQAGPGLMREAAARVAAHLGARADDLVFVDNVTAGANAVLRSVPLAAGDEIVLADHTYGAVINAARFVTRERGAALRFVEVPYPSFDAGVFVERMLAAIGPSTRLVIVDHISSESAIVLPVADVVAGCRERGVPVLVDGAHAPGVLSIDLTALGADWYTANLHKWAHAPRSCGILWAASARQAGLHPPVISWGLDQGFTAEFDWVGTRDPSAYLAAPEGLAWIETLGEPARRYMHDLAWRAARELTGAWGTVLSVTEDTVGAMVTVPLPAPLGSAREDAARLRDRLLFTDAIEVQVHAGYGRLWVRVSVQVYNEWSDIVRLRDAVLRAAS